MDKAPHLRKGRQKAPRGEETRERILAAAIEVFGLNGFDGASTRLLARAAGVNIQAIQYYFGSKDGLFLAAADHIVGQVKARLGPAAELIRGRLQTADESAPLTADEARQLLFGLASRAADMMVSEDSAPWARFILREQMTPTTAFEHLYEGIMGPMLALVGQLVAILMEADPDSEPVRLRAIGTFSQIVIFRLARAAAMRQLGWDETGERELAALRGLIRESIDAIAPLKKEPGQK